MADKPNPNPPTGTQPPAPNTPPVDEDAGLGYPEGTPIAEMTHAEQAAYWKAYSRRHEDAEKAAKAEADKAKAEADELRKAQMSEAEKVIQQARDEARKEGETFGASQWQKVAVEQAVIGVARTSGLYHTAEQQQAVADLIDTLDLSKFITADQKLDTTKIEKTLGALAPVPALPGKGSAGHAAQVQRLLPGGSQAGSVTDARQRHADAYAKKQNR